MIDQAPRGFLPRDRTLQVVGATAFFVVLTIVFTWPVSIRGDRLLAGTPGDSLGVVWGIDFMEKALLQLHHIPLFTTSINYPEGWSLATFDMGSAMAIGAIPVSLWLGPVAGYNFVSLVSFPLSGLVVFVYVRRWTGSWLAALFAGTAFAFSPFRITQYLVGHSGLLQTQWPALYLLSMYDLTTSRRAGWVDVAWPVLGLVLTALSSLYFLYMALLLSVAMLVAVVPWRSGIVEIRRALARAAGVWLLALPFLALAALPNAAHIASAGTPSRSLSYLRMYSASPTDYLLPPTFGLALGQWVGAHFDRDLWVEATLYVGVVCLFVASLGLLWKSGKPGRSRPLTPWVVVMATAFALSLGTDLNWLSLPVQVRVPDILRSLHAGELAFVPMPGRLALAWLPYYGAMRVWMRYGMFVGLALYVLAGVALHRLLSTRGSRTAAVLGTLAILALLLDFAPRRLPYFEVHGEPIDDWLQEQSLPGAVIEFPFEEVDQYQLYRTTIHTKPLVGCLYTTCDSPQHRERATVLAGFPDQASVDLLADLGVTYVVVDMTRYPDPDAIRARVSALGLEMGACRAERCAYALSQER
ncbi:MAG: hypothetical protein NTU91_00675 [Chloroflexi bacterium]|jgi:hypothetical protein|nr:hypothetical protein [Chloroflexota bacterium]